MDFQSTAQLLGNLGEFIGSIAVVLTLGYLAVQIRQNTKISKATATDHAARSWADSNIELLKSESVWQAFRNAHDPALDVGTLSSEDEAKARLAVRVMLQRFNAEFYLFKSGLLEEQMWASRRKGALDLIATPIGQRWWERSKTMYPEEFVSAIEDG